MPINVFSSGYKHDNVGLIVFYVVAYITYTHTLYSILFI